MNNLNDQTPQPKIMIVDDNTTNVMLLDKMLTISGYTNILTTTDSRETIELYNAFQPDLLLLDLQMPYVSGFDILEQLNTHRQGDYLPVIVITAQSDKGNRMKALELGAKDFILKPFERSELLVRIQNMLEIRLLHNRIKEHNVILEEKVRERTKELEDLQLDLIERLSKATEIHDNDTGYHVKRMGMYAYEFAKAAGLAEKECILLKNASMMHDIGKVGIPDDILLKSGKLNAEEWALMMTHSKKGADILTNSKYEVIQTAEIIALTHHERWDGTGYPRGMAGEEIPLYGRITAICDVFDALVSERPYKKAWSLEESIQEIKNCSGTYFDPALVQIFTKNIDKFIEIQDTFH